MLIHILQALLNSLDTSLEFASPFICIGRRLILLEMPRTCQICRKDVANLSSHMKRVHKRRLRDMRGVTSQISLPNSSTMDTDNYTQKEQDGGDDDTDNYTSLPP